MKASTRGTAWGCMKVSMRISMVVAYCCLVFCRVIISRLSFRSSGVLWAFGSTRRSSRLDCVEDVVKCSGGRQINFAWPFSMVL